MEHPLPLEHEDSGKSEPKTLKHLLKHKIRRGYGKKNCRKCIKGNKNIKLCILGTNANGLLGKQESWKNAVNNFKPSIITVQETKINRMGQIKLKGYQIFENIRTVGKGGGLLTAVDEDMFPVLISTGENDEAEFITVQVKAGNHDIRIINAYGPQEDDNIVKIYNFWEEIENEIISAKDNNCLILLQLDANAKVGKQEIPGDPNEISNNGKIMLEMVKRQGLIIANKLENCKGVITRERKSGNLVEKAVLDYLIICTGMMDFFEDMVVDEERVHVLTKYGKKRNVLSDHNILYSNFNLTFNRRKTEIRREFFNFKNKDDQQIFLEETTKTLKLSSSFSNHRTFPHNANIFFKNLKGTFQNTFKKIRITSGNKYKLGEKTLQGLLEQKNKLKVSLLNTKFSKEKVKVEEQLKAVEKNLTNNFAAKSAEMIREHIKEVEGPEGNFSQLGFWKIKKKFCPKPQDPPMAKRNEEGMLITSQNLLKKLYIQTYTHRLRQREMKKEYLDLFFLKTELWKSRMDELVGRKSEPWNNNDLIKVLKSLKNNKTMDQNFQIFKPGCIGVDLQEALLLLFNGIKSNFFYT